MAAIVRRLRHWKQRFRPGARFIFRRGKLYGGTQYQPGDPVPEILAQNKLKLQRFWLSQVIELAEFEEPDVATGQVPTQPIDLEFDDDDVRAVFARTEGPTPPPQIEGTEEQIQDDSFMPPDTTEVPQGVDEILTHEWIAGQVRRDDDTWSEFGPWTPLVPDDPAADPGSPTGEEAPDDPNPAAAGSDSGAGGDGEGAPDTSPVASPGDDKDGGEGEEADSVPPASDDPSPAGLSLPAQLVEIKVDADESYIVPAGTTIIKRGGGWYMVVDAAGEERNVQGQADLEAFVKKLKE